MARAGVTPERVVDEAVAVADESGWDSLTLAAVADRLGVRAPSLYKHVGGLPDLRRLAGVRAKRELAAVLSAAAVGRSRGEALRSLAHAYRDWARARPGLYAAAQVAPSPDDPEDQEASGAAVRVVFEALRGYGASEETMVDATRTLRAGLHGFVALDAAGGYALPRPLADSMDWWLDSLDAALSG
ncbi:MAG: TetR/AcrR family transcriptional regulator [Actinomycetes bacterium]